MKCKVYKRNDVYKRLTEIMYTKETYRELKIIKR